MRSRACLAIVLAVLVGAAACSSTAYVGTPLFEDAGATRTDASPTPEGGLTAADAANDSASAVDAPTVLDDSGLIDCFRWTGSCQPTAAECNPFQKPVTGGQCPFLNGTQKICCIPRCYPANPGCPSGTTLASDPTCAPDVSCAPN